MSYLANDEQYQYYKELLSSLSDGELSNHELDILMSGLQHYPELKAYWQRLQLKNSILKKAYEQPINQSWLDKIKNALEASAFDTAPESASILAFSKTQAQISKKKKPSKEKFSAFTHFAIAASVMVVVVAAWLGSQPELRELALRYLADPTAEVIVHSDESQKINEQIGNTKIAMTRTINANNQMLASAGNVSSEPSETANDLYLSKPRLQNYMLLHAEHASLNTNQGLLPFARMNKVSKENQF